MEGLTSEAQNAEIYDPETGKWTIVSKMHYTRILHTASLLNNGTVLLAGGESPEGHYLNSTELFDPTTESWTLGNNMHERRARHTVSLLTGGKVLIAGGYYHYDKPVRTAEIYDPST